MESNIEAPFNPEQVKALQWFQRGLAMAPYTCDKASEKHKSIGQRPVLKADTFGLTCPECNAVRESVPAGVIEYALRLLQPDAEGDTSPKKGRKKG